MIGALARKLFGSANDRRVRKYQPRVDAINALEKELEKLSDEALRARTEAFREAGARRASRSTISWFRPSRPCARRPSARSASAISTCS